MTLYIAEFGLLIGLAYSLACLASPSFAARSVRLQADPHRSGGYAEFRATFGGVFGALHLSALIFLIFLDAPAGQIAAFIVACGWLGAAVGRMLAIIFDGDKDINNALNLKLSAFEVVMGVAIGAPLLQVWLLT